MSEPISKLWAMINYNYLPQTCEPSLADHAELWAKDKVVIPSRNTPEWDAIYQAWIEFAFADFQTIK